MLCKPKPTRSARRAECRLLCGRQKKTNRYPTKSCNSGLTLPTAHGAAVHLRVRTFLLSAQARRAAGALPSLSLSTIYVDIRFHRILRLSPAGLSEHGTKVVNFARTAKFNFENYQQLLNNRIRRATLLATAPSERTISSPLFAAPSAPQTAGGPPPNKKRAKPSRSAFHAKTAFSRFQCTKTTVIKITVVKFRIFGQKIDCYKNNIDKIHGFYKIPDFCRYNVKQKKLHLQHRNSHSVCSSRTAVRREDRPASGLSKAGSGFQVRLVFGHRSAEACKRCYSRHF